MQHRIIEINAVVINDGKVIDKDMVAYCKSIFENIYIYENIQEACDNIKQLFTKNISIDILITSEILNDQSSFTLIKKLREFNHDLFSIIFTQKEYIDEMNDISYYNLFQKLPIELDQLDKIIETIISRTKVRKEYRIHNSLSLQYQNALDTTAIVSKTDKDGIITYVNDAFCALSQYSKEELLGQNHNILRDPKHPQSLFKKMWATIKAKMIYTYDVMSNIAKDGSRYYVNTTVFPILDENREIVEYMSVRHDVTNMMKSLIAEKKAKEAQKRFLANMSHEIRTPLNAILGFSNILMDDEVSKKDQKEYIHNIHTGSEVLLELINNILDISKIESGKLEIENSSCDLFREYDDLVHLLKSKADEKSLDFVSSIDERLKYLSFNTDITKIKQIFSNLISNAIKFTPQGNTIQSSLQIVELNDTKGIIEYKIIDTGIGIESNKIEKIFQPFIQEDQSITREFGGTGLGLYITKEIVELLGGTIEVQSVKSKGTTFSITLPLELDLSVKDMEKSKIECVEDNQQFQGDVLVVEDVPLNQKLIKIFLEKKGLGVILANDGIEGIDSFKANEKNISMVFMDINMPRLDGVSAMLEINKIQENKSKKIPIVALTANAITGDREEFLNKGFDEYLAKPIKEEKLLQILYLFLNTKGSAIDRIEETKNDAIEDLANNLGLPIDLYKEFVKDYIDLVQEDIPVLENYIQENDFDNIKDVSHKLKGVSGNIGLEKMYEYFALMENTNAPHFIIMRKIKKEFELIKQLG